MPNPSKSLGYICITLIIFHFFLLLKTIYIKHWNYIDMQNSHKTFERENLSFFEKHFPTKSTTRVTINLLFVLFVVYLYQLECSTLK